MHAANDFESDPPGRRSGSGTRGRRLLASEDPLSQLRTPGQVLTRQDAPGAQSLRMSQSLVRGLTGQRRTAGSAGGNGGGHRRIFQQPMLSTAPAAQQQTAKTGECQKRQ